MKPMDSQQIFMNTIVTIVINLIEEEPQKSNTY